MDVAHVVDIASLARQLKEELATADAPAARSASGCPVVIAEVGALTRNVCPEAYDPFHVSIGPYHRIKNPELSRDENKIRSLGIVLQLAASAGVTLEDYLELVARNEVEARNCYAHMFGDMESNYFVRMLLLDACYVLVNFGWRRGSGGDMMDAVGMVRDAIYLAENQIPFFVVDEIHKLTVPDGSGVSAADAVAGYVRELLQGQQYSVATPAVAGPPGPGNLLHLVHMHLKPTDAVRFSSSRTTATTGNRVAGKQRRFGRWRSATEYYCAGVGYRSRKLIGKDGAVSILDVKLDGRGGTLEIPQLKIDAETSRLLRNLMALEQSNLAEGSHVTAYGVFLSQLAGTARDVELLFRRGIIAHGLGSHDEVAACLADLCKGVAFGGDDPEENYLRATWQGLEESFRSRPRRWAAWLMLKYFRNPWLAVGLAAAAVGLVCTVVQAVYAVMAYSPNP